MSFGLQTVDICLFLLGTILLLWFSRRSLLHIRTHGFYRFFAFEGILFLFVINIHRWFDNPFAFGQLASWVLLIMSAYLAAHAFWLFHTAGFPSPQPRPGTDFAFEQTTHLITTGAYRYVRHPMYGSLLCLGWGICLKNATPLALILALCVSAFLFFTAKVEEAENLTHFGDPYRSYIRSTKRFIPFLW